MDNIVDLSRFQFAMTAMYHFIFVPLTLGLVWILAIMESLYVMTNKQVYKDMTKFWGKLFGINFAIGVTTGLTMNSSLVLTGLIILIMSEISSVRLWQLKA